MLTHKRISTPRSFKVTFPIALKQILQRGALRVSDIYPILQKEYPSLTQGRLSWKACVRHTLSCSPGVFQRTYDHSWGLAESGSSSGRTSGYRRSSSPTDRRSLYEMDALFGWFDGVSSGSVGGPDVPVGSDGSVGPDSLSELLFPFHDERLDLSLLQRPLSPSNAQEPLSMDGFSLFGDE